MAAAPPALDEALSHRYLIERELGEGGMATVYLAHDLKHQRKVAIKVLRPQLAALIGAERFLAEIRTTANLQHPHILPLFDSGEVGGLLYYVMPYIEGESLRDRLARDGPLPVPEALRILREVVDALSYAHTHGVIHRDIKPANVLLSSRHALVADFGVAKAVTAATEHGQLTTIGVAIGTPTYMAPEQATADPQMDHRVDLYAVGATAYELLTGRPPFVASTVQLIVAAHLTTPPDPVSRHRPAVPPAVETIVMRCLEKNPADRWPSADALLSELETVVTPSGGIPRAGVPAQQSRSRRRALAGAMVLAAVALSLAGMAYRRHAQEETERLWVREQAVPRIRQLADSGQWYAAFSLATRARERLPTDTALAALWPKFSFSVALRSEPPGARAWHAAYSDADTGWQYIATTPSDSVRVPNGFSRLRLEKAGFRPTVVAISRSTTPKQPYVLDDSIKPSDGTVYVPGGEIEINLPGLDHLPAIDLKGYRIGRYEVSNRDFKRFVDGGGYRTPKFWEHPFVLNEATLSWEQALGRFRDRTGRPGPATWEGGDYPTGQDDYPVSGVSWYEAAAYAAFAGSQLPTVYHWSRAAGAAVSSWIVPLSNFGGSGPAAAGQHKGMGPYGTFDMAGNVREWCLNQSGSQRYTLGGGWNDATYQFNDGYAQSPFDRSATNGFRLVKYADADPNLKAASQPITRLFRDFSKERPVLDHIFEVYRRMYDYDRTPLNSVPEGSDTSNADWVREKVSFDAAYGGERVTAYLFLPRRGRPPFQTIIYFPGSNAIHDRVSATGLQVGSFDFILKSGRAVLYPIYKSTYERGDSLRSDYADETNFYKEHVIAWVKDFRRSVDYLETRAEIDTARLAYYGVSWGGYLGGLVPALEPRLEASVLYVAGLMFQRAQPEVDPLNFLPRIRLPVLMLNGKYDHFFPVETSQKPMFRLLGTRPDRKRQVIHEGGHFVPRPDLIRETLDWLDRYLGPVQ